MKKLFRKILPPLFGLWTVIVMAAYFFFYQSYGQFYLNAFVLTLLLMAFIIPLSFFISFLFLVQEKDSSFSALFRRLPQTLSIPVRNLALSFYGCIATWILFICFLKPDVGISINSVVSVFLVTLITLSGFSVGSRLVRRFHIATNSLLERCILSTLLGFGVLMLIVYIAGMVGFLYGTAAYALVLSLLFVFRKEWLTLFSDIRETSLPWQVKPFFTFDNFAIITSFIFFVFATTGLLSQFAAGWDEMHTYQAFPHAYAEAHRIVDFKYWFASGFPQNTEMLYTLAHLLNGFTPAAGLNTVFYFLLPGILVLIKRVAFPKASSPVIVLLYTLSAIPYLMITVDHKIDLAFWCYTLLATLYLLKFFQTPERKTFFLFTILAGIAGGTKYNFFSIILPSFLIVLLFFPREFNLKKRLVHITLLLTIITICFSPWAVKNIIFSGNPVEPALGDILSRNDTFLKKIGRSYSEHLREQISDSYIFTENQERKDLPFLLESPIRFTLNSEKRNQSDITNIGPLFLIVLPLLLFRSAKENDTATTTPRRILGAIILLQLICWAILSNLNSWYAMPALLLLIPYIGYIPSERQFAFVKIPIFFSIVALSLATTVIRFDSVFRNGTLFIKEDSGEYDIYNVAEFLNNHDSRGIIWDSIGPSLNFYVQHSESRIVYDYYLHIFRFLQDKNGDTMVKKFRSIGVSYFVFKEGDLAQWLTSANSGEYSSPKTSALFRKSIEGYFAFRRDCLIEVFRSGNIAVYTYRDHQ